MNHRHVILAVIASVLLTFTMRIQSASAETAITPLAKASYSTGAMSADRVLDILSGIKEEEQNVTRGESGTHVYKTISPAVVLVFTEDGFGSGSLIGNDKVLTNWHVVGDALRVGVVFKPLKEGNQPTEKDVVLGDVLKVDEVTDLALIKLTDVPRQIEPIKLGSDSKVQVGSDVHAIGHPTGESWTYTRGFVSQFRRNYEWITESGVEHKATVVQTQTPINPGNSGGPLLTSDGKLIGVNSFKSSGEGLNFAVSVGEVEQFLKSEGSRKAQRTEESASENGCEMKVLDERRDDTDTSLIRSLDFDCDGAADALNLIPDDPSEPISLAFDTTEDGNLDTFIIDKDRNGEPDFSLYDTTGDGSFDLIGYYRNGEWEPYRFEEYAE